MRLYQESWLIAFETSEMHGGLSRSPFIRTSDRCTLLLNSKMLQCKRYIILFQVLGFQSFRKFLPLLSSSGFSVEREF